MRLSKPINKKKRDHDVYSIPSSTDSRPSTPESKAPRRLPTPLLTPPARRSAAIPQEEGLIQGLGSNALPEGDTIVVVTSQPPQGPAPEPNRAGRSRGSGLKRKRVPGSRLQTVTQPSNCKRIRSSQDGRETTDTTDYRIVSAVQISRVSPELGTITIDHEPSGLKIESRGEAWVPPFRWVDTAPTTFEQTEALFPSETTETRTQPTALPEIPETPPSSPMLPAVDPQVILSPARRNVVPKDETPSPTLIESAFDISAVPVHFISASNKIMRTRSVDTFRGCVKRFFVAADGANIINDEIDKLTVTIYGTEHLKTERGGTLNVMRDFQEDFDEMEQMIKTTRAGRIEVKRGVKNTLETIE